jgi:hypothetical protein
MTNQHPITPPPELVQQWASESLATQHLCSVAARWGADQELEACCEWLFSSLCEDPQEVSQELRTARRPKPSSLKEQALKALHTSVDLDEFPKQYDTIRTALEALPND